jgi:spermidine synthase
MREMLGVFAGNEMVLGVALGNWLLTMGLGAALGRWIARRNASSGVFVSLLTCTAIIPPVQIIILRSLRQFLFLPGEAVGVFGTVLLSFLVLLPYCLCAGLFLALACRALATKESAESAGRVYTMDSLGSVAGGALFSFILVWWFDHVALLAIPALLNTLAATWLAWRARQKFRPAFGLALALMLVLGFAVVVWIVVADPDVSSTARQFPGQQIVFRGSSPYGRLVVAQSAGQTNVIENGLVLVSTPNIEAAEEAAHFAMAQRPGAKKVLLVGGSLSGTPREILRYPVTALDCVELDPLIILLGRKFLSSGFSDPRLRLFEADPRQFIRHAQPGTYDVIILALPDPSTAQLNRLFTEEFFHEAGRSLRPSGILSFVAGRYENYAGAELVRLLSCARQTATRSFPHVLLIPGLRVYFFASNEPLTTNIASGLDRAGVTPRWVTRDYLAAALAPDRLADIERAAGKPAPVNRDFSPVLYYLHLRHWASQFEIGSSWLWLLLVLLAVIYVARLRGAARIIFASGFAGAAVEIVLLLAMQTFSGSVYRQVAWVVTLFMAGLATGAWVATRRLCLFSPNASHASAKDASHCSPLPATRAVGNPSPGSDPRRDQLCLLALAVAILAALITPLLPALTHLSLTGPGHIATQLILLSVTFLLASIVGAQFPLANALTSEDKSPAARLYAADFLGAALGAILTSCWLLPLAGVNGVCWISSGVNMIAALFLFRTKISP